MLTATKAESVPQVKAKRAGWNQPNGATSKFDDYEPPSWMDAGLDEWVQGNLTITDHPADDMYKARRIYLVDGEVIDPETIKGSSSSQEEKGVVLDSIQSAGKYLASLWSKLEARYGRKLALTMAVAMVATLPLPGTIPAIIAVAEGIRGVRGKELELGIIEKNYDVKIEREGGKWNAYELVDGKKDRLLASSYSREVMIEQMSRVTGGRFTLKAKDKTFKVGDRVARMGRIGTVDALVNMKDNQGRPRAGVHVQWDEDTLAGEKSESWSIYIMSELRSTSKPAPKR